jgi:pyruvate,water dikinase
MTVKTHTINLAQLGMRDLEQVGGKNASLGEMISHLKNFYRITVLIKKYMDY